MVAFFQKTFCARNLFRAFFYGAVALLVQGYARPLRQSTPLPPDFSLLKAGDVVVTFSGEPLAWFLATGGQVLEHRDDSVLFSHTEIVIPGKKGEWMLAGVSSGNVRSRPFKKALSEFQQIAVFRLREPIGGAAAAQQVEKWLDDPEIRGAFFDYRLGGGESSETKKFYCIGFVNSAYRDSGFPPPFLPAKNPKETPSIRHFSTLFHADIGKTPLAGSITQNPAYQKIFFWENMLMPEEQKWLNKMIARTGAQFYQEHWEIKPKKYRFTTIVLRLIKPIHKLPPEVEMAAAFQASIRGFCKKVRAMWYRLERRGRLVGLTEEERVALVQKICEKYRDDFFQPTTEK
jgi:hypothetical protein